MKKYIDMGIDFVRKHTYFNFVEIGEDWIAKIGVWALYFVFPALAFLVCVSHGKSIDDGMGINPLLMLVIVALVSIFLGYVADKTLDYVKPTIKSAQTRIVNSGILDLLAVVFALLGVVIFFGAFYASIKMDKIVLFAIGLGALVLGAYLVAILLNPEKSLNVKVTESATPAQSLLAIFSIFAKLLYRLVIVVFAAAMIFFVFKGFDMLFANTYEFMNAIKPLFYDEDLVAYINVFLFLPLIGYFFFLWYYFFIDFSASILHMASDVKKIADSKESHKSK